MSLLPSVLHARCDSCRYWSGDRQAGQEVPGRCMLWATSTHSGGGCGDFEYLWTDAIRGGAMTDDLPDVRCSVCHHAMSQKTGGRRYVCSCCGARFRQDMFSGNAPITATAIPLDGSAPCDGRTPDARAQDEFRQRAREVVIACHLTDSSDMPAHLKGHIILLAQALAALDEPQG